jgi:hypothetical protein
MPDDSPKGDLNSHLLAELTPLFQELRERLGVDADTWDIVLAGLTRTAFIGARVGVAEALAQAVEQGVNINLKMEINEPSLDELLAADDDD